jgi:hypothetical protein
LAQQQDGHHLPAQFLNQLDGRIESAASGQHVVDQHHAVSLLHQVLLHLDHVIAVLQPVGELLALARQLPLLADGVAGLAHPQRQRRAEEEALRFQHEHLGVLHLLEPVLEGVDDQREGRRVRDYRKDIDELNARLGEVGVPLGRRLYLLRVFLLHPDISFIRWSLKQLPTKSAVKSGGMSGGDNE